MSWEKLNLYDIVILALRKAMNLGADEAEAYAIRIKDHGIMINNNMITSTETHYEIGVGIRVIINNKIGYASTNNLSIQSIEKTIMDAISIAKASEKDPYWHGLPIPTEYEVPENMYSVDLARVSEDSLAEKSRELLDLIISDKRLVVVYGSVSASLSSIAIANTNGVSNIQHLTHSIIYVGVVANENGDVTPVISDFIYSRTNIPDVESIANRVKDYALTSLHPVKINSMKAPVILHPNAVNSLLQYTLLDAIKGDNVVRGKSYLTGKEGKQVFSEKLTITDNGLLKNGLFTRMFDDEGTAMKNTLIIDKGIVRGFIFDNYWALRYGSNSTGNAIRSSYKGVPRIAPTNVIIGQGDASLNEIIAETRRGLLVYELQGAHSSNPETGEYSVVATPAWYVENGVLKPVRGVMLSGNIYDDLSKIEFISKEFMQKGHVVAPYIRLEDVNIIVKG